MRILHIGPYPPARDGIGVYTRTLAGALTARGHETAVVSARPHPSSPPEVMAALGDPALPEKTARFRPDVVHLQFAVPAFGPRTPAVLRLLDALDAPVVATLHEAARDLALLRAPGRMLYRRLTDRCAALVVHTRDAQRAAGPKAVLIPHFCAPPPPPATTPDALRERFGLGSAPVLLAFGFIHVDKGLDVLVDALRSLQAPVTLVVAGTVRGRTGPFRLMELRDHLHERGVRASIRRHGLENRVVFTGYVPDEEVAAWFAAADVAVLPYRKAAQSGVAHLALAMNVPVVATGVGGLRELFGSSTVPPGDAEAFAKAVTEALDGGGSPSPGVPPGPEEVAARTEALYEKVLAGAA
ncbi:glycosyltransferase [Actinocorallia aurantiaca]|uniref:Glycosyltransferase n=1 Tax=Actinocorallia aurantiaca TaxID=46204 RepID=A0ABN3U2B0_9ACTN